MKLQNFEFRNNLDSSVDQNNGQMLPGCEYMQYAQYKS